LTPGFALAEAPPAREPETPFRVTDPDACPDPEAAPMAEAVLVARGVVLAEEVALFMGVAEEGDVLAAEFAGAADEAMAILGLVVWDMAVLGVAAVFAAVAWDAGAVVAGAAAAAVDPVAVVMA